MATIKVRKPPKSAYNPERKASDLLKRQIAHLEWAVRHAGQRKPAQMKRIKPVRTEAEAAARTDALMRQLPSASELPIPPAEPVQPARSRRAARSTARRASARRSTRARTRRRTR